MTKKETIHTILLLSLVSMCIYGLQIIIFHDLRNTEFYILQDLAFIPISIAITTIVVGNIIDNRSKKEAAEKAGMLRAAFFTDIGRVLLRKIYSVADDDYLACLNENLTAQEKRARLKEASVTVHLNKDTYEFTRTFLQEKQRDLMILTGNNDLMDQDDFTQMLGGLFHLLDEFRLRGTYDDLSEQDLTHMNEDFAKVFVLLGINSAANAEFQQMNFPDFYQTIIKKNQTNNN